MKKEIVSSKEKFERVVIRRKLRQRQTFAGCERCSGESELLTVDEMAALTGADVEFVRACLWDLRSKTSESN